MADDSSSLFAKHWCSKFNDGWYRSLKCIERGAYDQMIDIAKRDGDTGVIFRRNFSDFSHELGLFRTTGEKILRKFSQDEKIKLTENGNGIKIELVNYMYQQHIRGTAQEKKRRKSGEKSRKNLPINIREEKRREEGNSKELPESMKTKF
jgi:hypothetical protein